MSRIDDLANKFKRKSTKVACSFNIPDWLDSALEQTVADLRVKGAKVTKGDVITEAIQEFLAVQAPE